MLDHESTRKRQYDTSPLDTREANVGEGDWNDVGSTTTADVLHKRSRRNEWTVRSISLLAYYMANTLQEGYNEWTRRCHDR